MHKACFTPGGVSRALRPWTSQSTVLKAQPPFFVQYTMPGPPDAARVKQAEGYGNK